MVQRIYISCCGVGSWDQVNRPGRCSNCGVYCISALRLLEIKLINSDARRGCSSNTHNQRSSVLFLALLLIQPENTNQILITFEQLNIRAVHVRSYFGSTTARNSLGSERKTPNPPNKRIPRKLNKALRHRGASCKRRDALGRQSKRRDGKERGRHLYNVSQDRKNIKRTNSVEKRMKRQYDKPEGNSEEDRVRPPASLNLTGLSVRHSCWKREEREFLYFRDADKSGSARYTLDLDRIIAESSAIIIGSPSNIDAWTFIGVDLEQKPQRLIIAIITVIELTNNHTLPGQVDMVAIDVLELMLKERMQHVYVLYIKYVVVRASELSAIQTIHEPTCTIGGQLIFMSVEARELFDVSGISGILAVKAVDSPYTRNIDSIANCGSLTYVCISLLGFAVLFPPRTSTFDSRCVIDGLFHARTGKQIADNISDDHSEKIVDISLVPHSYVNPIAWKHSDKVVIRYTLGISEDSSHTKFLINGFKLSQIISIGRVGKIE
ncbi:hypothetical protein EAG_03216 [Camponotus floridanus]|uniref:Uncharacterized protein n=1 Tax=Camponotus floridanus TaxID=104421 RepID=E2B238_CAMFO|nr:hypothetical protein EAG_03216 [Camponotus floridanus]